MTQGVVDLVPLQGPDEVGLRVQVGQRLGLADDLLHLVLADERESVVEGHSDLLGRLRLRRQHHLHRVTVAAARLGGGSGAFGHLVEVAGDGGDVVRGQRKGRIRRTHASSLPRARRSFRCGVPSRHQDRRLAVSLDSIRSLPRRTAVDPCRQTSGISTRIYRSSNVPVPQTPRKHRMRARGSGRRLGRARAISAGPRRSGRCS